MQYGAKRAAAKLAAAGIPVVLWVRASLDAVQDAFVGLMDALLDIVEDGAAASTQGIGDRVQDVLRGAPSWSHRGSCRCRRLRRRRRRRRRRGEGRGEPPAREAGSESRWVLNEVQPAAVPIDASSFQIPIPGLLSRDIKRVDELRDCLEIERAVILRGDQRRCRAVALEVFGRLECSHSKFKACHRVSTLEELDAMVYARHCASGVGRRAGGGGRPRHERKRRTPPPSGGAARVHQCAAPRDRRGRGRGVADPDLRAWTSARK